MRRVMCEEGGAVSVARTSSLTYFLAGAQAVLFASDLEVCGRGETKIRTAAPMGSTMMSVT